MAISSDASGLLDHTLLHCKYESGVSRARLWMLLALGTTACLKRSMAVGARVDCPGGCLRGLEPGNSPFAGLEDTSHLCVFRTDSSVRSDVT